MKRIFTFIACLLVCAAAGLVGTLATIPQIPVWYSGLVKPSFNPPAWVFGPAWTILYILMAVSLYLYVQKPAQKPKLSGYIFFFIQLCLNASWSVVFFGYHNPQLALRVIILLWFTILATMLLFSRHSRLAGALFIPYISWVSFAMILNFAISALNPALPG